MPQPLRGQSATGRFARITAVLHPSWRRSAWFARTIVFRGKPLAAQWTGLHLTATCSALCLHRQNCRTAQSRQGFSSRSGSAHRNSDSCISSFLIFHSCSNRRNRIRLQIRRSTTFLRGVDHVRNYWSDRQGRRAVARSLLTHGQKVRAVVRNAEKGRSWSAEGFRPTLLMSSEGRVWVISLTYTNICAAFRIDTLVFLLSAPHEWERVKYIGICRGFFIKQQITFFSLTDVKGQI
jgi:hypothetical protein